MRLVGYVRVSTNGQAERGFGLDVQEAQIAEWAAANGHEVARICRDEGISGTTDAVDRPGLACALGALPDDADAVIVARLDRLARSLTVQEAILAMIWRDGGTVLSVDQGEVMQDDPDDPMRKAMRQMVGVFAELDRALVMKRLRDGRKAKAAAGGKAVGRYPFGWSRDGEVEREQAVLGVIRELRARGLDWRTLAAELNERGPEFGPRYADEWSVGTVNNVGRKAGIP